MNLETLTRRDFLGKITKTAGALLLTPAYQTLDALLPKEAHAETIDHIIRHPDGRIKEILTRENGQDTIHQQYVYKNGKLDFIHKRDLRPQTPTTPHTYNFETTYQNAWKNLRDGNTETAGKLINQMYNKEDYYTERLHGLNLNHYYHRLKRSGYNETDIKRYLDQLIKSALHRQPKNEFLQHAQERYQQNPHTAIKLTGESWNTYKHGHELFQQKKYGDAEALLRASLDLDPHNVEAWVKLSTVRRHQGKTTKEKLSNAITILEKGLEYNPSSELLLTGQKTYKKFLSETK